MKHFLWQTFLILASLLKCTAAGNTSQQSHSTADIQMMLEKLNVLGSAMYIAAHPDDENTRLITYLAQKRLVDVSYLSLTRGDGGQNMIGTEIGELLGVIRTQELLSARRIDGGEQFFTRANDFGYSKTWEETLNIWDEEAVLSDMVFVIRKFKPDVLITRFAPLKYNYPTHGHHSASAYLSEKAFDMAGDPKAFPEQLKLVDVWQPKRLYWNTSTWFYRRTNTELDPAGKLQLDVGAYVPALGLSCTEIAAESRSQHKSQGFGAAKTRGTEIEYLEYVMGDSAASDLFEGIDLTWDKFEIGQEVGELLKQAYDEYDPKNPTAVLKNLLDAYKILEGNKSTLNKREDIKQAVAAICGLHMESIANAFSAVPGDEIELTTTIINRSQADVQVKNLTYSVKGLKDKNIRRQLDFNQPYESKDTLRLPDDIELSQPYWLMEEATNIGIYNIQNEELTGLPEAPVNLATLVALTINGVEMDFILPFQYKWTDRVKGELYRHFVITPRLTVNLKEKVIIFPDQQVKRILLQVKAWDDQVSGELSLHLPKGWKSEPEKVNVDLKNRGDESVFLFSVKPPKQAGVIDLQPVFEGSKAKSFVELDYDHIPIQNIWPVAKTKLVRLDIEKNGNRIGYIMGAGDEVPDNLTQIGYDIHMINEQNVIETDFGNFDAIIIGIRAYNTEKWLVQQYDKLMDYVKNGGNLIVQYQTTRGLLTEDIGPYSFKLSQKRVTVEQAPVILNDPNHTLFHMPNKITDADFEDWVQERGLYFAEEWDERYQTPFTMNDPGEEPLTGSLLLTHYGKGTFIYTGISFFRELPAGVPGAFRLLANMISYEHE